MPVVPHRCSPRGREAFAGFVASCDTKVCISWRGTVLEEEWQADAKVSWHVCLRPPTQLITSSNFMCHTYLQVNLERHGWGTADNQAHKVGVSDESGSYLSERRANRRATSNSDHRVARCLPRATQGFLGLYKSAIYKELDSTPRTLPYILKQIGKIAVTVVMVHHHSPFM